MAVTELLAVKSDLQALTNTTEGPQVDEQMAPDFTISTKNSPSMFDIDWKAVPRSSRWLFFQVPSSYDEVAEF